MEKQRILWRFLALFINDTWLTEMQTPRQMASAHRETSGSPLHLLLFIIALRSFLHSTRGITVSSTHSKKERAAKPKEIFAPMVRDVV
jgi:hypothetical protein